MAKQDTVLVTHSICEKRTPQKVSTLPEALAVALPDEVWISQQYSHSAKLSASATRGQRIKFKLAKYVSKNAANTIECESTAPRRMLEHAATTVHCPETKITPENDRSLSCQSYDTGPIAALTASVHRGSSNKSHSKSNIIAPSGSRTPAIAEPMKPVLQFSETDTSRLNPGDEKEATVAEDNLTAEVTKEQNLSTFVAIDAMIELSSGVSTKPNKPREPLSRLKKRARSSKKSRTSRMSRRSKRYEVSNMENFQVPAKGHHFRRWLNASRTETSNTTTNRDSREACMARMPEKTNAAVEAGQRYAPVGSHSSDLDWNCYTNFSPAVDGKGQVSEIVLQDPSISTGEASPRNKVDSIDLLGERSFVTESIHGLVDSKGDFPDMEACSAADHENDADGDLIFETHSKIPMLMSQLEQLTPKSALLESLILNDELVGGPRSALSIQKQCLPKNEAYFEDNFPINAPTIKAPQSVSSFAESLDNEQARAVSSNFAQTGCPTPPLNENCCELETGASYYDKEEMPTICPTPLSASISNIWGFFGKATKVIDGTHSETEPIMNPTVPLMWKALKLSETGNDDGDNVIPMRVPEAFVSPFGEEKIGYAF